MYVHVCNSILHNIISAHNIMYVFIQNSTSVTVQADTYYSLPVMNCSYKIQVSTVAIF